MTDKKQRDANALLQQQSYLAKEEFQAEMQKAQARNSLWQYSFDLAVRAGKTTPEGIIAFGKEITDAMDTFKEVAYNIPEPTIKESKIELLR